MYWTELSCNELMKRVFSKPPEVGYIDLFDIEIKRDGPTIIISFDLVDILPDRTPIKWGKDFNRCRLGLYCLGVSDLVISGVSKSMKAEVFFDIHESSSKIKIIGDNFKISFKYLHINLTGPSVYLSK